MKVKFSYHLLVLLLYSFATRALSAENDDICRYFATGTKLRDPLSCGQYITCNNFVAEYTACPANTPYYNKDTQKCVVALTDYSNCQIPCEEYAGKFINDATSCNGYLYCQNAETSIYGVCPDNTHFDFAKQSCIYKSESSCKLNEFDICQIAMNGVTVKNPNDCRSYYECKKDVLTEASCATGKYYDTASGTCLEKWQVECPNLPLPSAVCGTEKKTLANTYVADDATCRGYFYCADKGDVPDPAPLRGQCPAGTFFNSPTQSCGSPLESACPSGADRCEGRNLTFVSAQTKGCRNYLRCKDGKTVETLSCGNKFFDEVAVVCTSTPVIYPSCKS